MDRATSFSENTKIYGKKSETVIESVIERRINSRIIDGLRNFKCIWRNSSKGAKERLANINISEEEKQEIQNILKR